MNPATILTPHHPPCELPNQSDAELEDGLLMMAFCLERIPALTALAAECSFDATAPVVDVNHIPVTELIQMRHANRKADHDIRIILMVVAQSTFEGQAQLLKHYHLDMEVHMWRYGKIAPGTEKHDMEFVNYDPGPFSARPSVE